MGPGGSGRCQGDSRVACLESKVEIGESPDVNFRMAKVRPETRCRGSWRCLQSQKAFFFRMEPPRK